jgi:hypothetical protein
MARQGKRALFYGLKVRCITLMLAGLKLVRASGGGK